MKGDDVKLKMLTKYIGKHFRIYKIENLYPKKNKKLKFVINEKSCNKDVDSNSLVKFLSNIFLVDKVIADEAVHFCVHEEVRKLRELQYELNFDYEQNNT
jgi:hypothetical protein